MVIKNYIGELIFCNTAICLTSSVCYLPPRDPNRYYFTRDVHSIYLLFNREERYLIYEGPYEITKRLFEYLSDQMSSFYNQSHDIDINEIVSKWENENETEK